MANKQTGTNELGAEEVKIFKEVTWYKDIVSKMIKYAENVYLDGEKKYFIRESNIMEVFARFNMKPNDHIANLKKYGFFEDKNDDPVGYYIITKGHPKLSHNILSTKRLQGIAKKLLKICRISENAKTKERWQFLPVEEITEEITSMGLRPKIVIGQLLDKHYLLPMNTLPIKPNAYLIFATQKEGKDYRDSKGHF